MKTHTHARRAIVAALSLLALSTQAQAAIGDNLILNGDFESLTNYSETYIQGQPANQSYCYLNGSSCLATDWFATAKNGDNGVAIVGTINGPWSPLQDPQNTHGNYVAALQGGGELIKYLDLDAGTYTLSWDEVNRTNAGGTQRYDVRFNGSQLSSPYESTGSWQTRSVTFSLDSKTSRSLSFRGLALTDSTAFIDNVKLVQLNTAVPEPSSQLLMLLGLIGTSMLVRRNRARKAK